MLLAVALTTTALSLFGPHLSADDKIDNYHYISLSIIIISYSNIAVHFRSLFLLLAPGRCAWSVVLSIQQLEPHPPPHDHARQRASQHTTASHDERPSNDDTAAHSQPAARAAEPHPQEQPTATKALRAAASSQQPANAHHQPTRMMQQPPSIRSRGSLWWLLLLGVLVTRQEQCTSSTSKYGTSGGG